MTFFTKLLFLSVCLTPSITIGFETAAQDSKAVQSVFKNALGAPSQRIEAKPESQFLTMHASDNDKALYISEIGGILHLYDLESFEKIWTTDLGGTSVSNMLELGEFIYIVTNTETENEIKDNGSQNASVRVLWQVDKKSGITTGKKEVEGGKGSSQLFKSGADLVYSSAGICVLFFEGQLEKNKKFDLPMLSGAVENVARTIFDVDKSELFLVFSDQIIKVSLEGESTGVKLSFDMENITAFDITEEFFVIGDRQGNLYGIGRQNSERLWHFRAGGSITDIQISPGKVLVSSYDNFVYGLSSTNGKRIWKKRFSGRIEDINILDDRYILAAAVYSSDHFLIDTTDGIITDIYSADENKIKQLIQTSRLIMILTADSVDIRKKN